MADLVVVMGDGRIHQAAAPVEIYRKPADAFVADFIGSTNLLDIAASGSSQALFDGVPLPGVILPAGVQRARLSIRPEDVRLTDPANATLTGRVTFLRDLGGTVETFVEAADTTIVAVSTRREQTQVAAGEQIGIRLPAEACVVLTR
ncbi:MAG: TOBE domain-containing protein, partial [Rhodospirillaceae bacterium]|nr:TOBE domain-containing protein [Rhodospirillaceae bacterium]